MKRLSLSLVQILVFVVGWMPFRLLYGLSGLLYHVMYHLLKYRRKVVLGNLTRSFPQKKEEDIAAISSAYYRHLSDLMLETVKGFSMSRKEYRKRFHYRNPEVFDPYFEKKQSLILLGSHYGNWEWGSISFPLAVRHKVIGVYKPLKNNLLENYLNLLRKKWGLHLTDMRTAGRAFVAKENQPAIFVLIADQTPSDVANAHWVDFLGQDTPFHHGADKLARHTGFPVFHFQIKKIKRGYYEVVFEEISLAPKTVNPGEITMFYANRLEAMIRQDPAFWLWSHQRWKRKRPA